MKIAFFTDVFLPKIDGAVTSLLNLSEELANAGHEVLIVAPRPKKGDQITKVFKKRKLLLVPSVSGLVYPQLRIATPSFINLHRQIKKFNPDIIHANTPLTLGINSILIANILKKPIIATLHSAPMEKEFFKTFKLKHTKTAQKFLVKYTNFYFDRCDLVFSPSAYLAKRLKKTGLKSKVVVLSNGIKLNSSKKNKTNIKSLRQKYPLKDFNLLFIGRLSFEKEIDVLIKAIKILKTQIPNLSFLIIGDGPAKKELEELTQKLKLTDTVFFLGTIDHQKLLKSGLYQQAHLFISASRCEVQASDTVGLAEIVRNNGLLVRKKSPKNFSRAILTLYQNKDLYQKIKQNIAKSKFRYDIKNIAKTALRYYQKVSKQKKSFPLANVLKTMKPRFFKKYQTEISETSN